jgi:putative glycosyltransferase (TIGR04348 family)
MKITVITPAPRYSRKGNRITALRWARLLRELGHQVEIATEFQGNPCDLVVALHARRSYPSIAKFKREHPSKPLMVALTGTDLYNDIHSDADAQTSLELADRLIVLQPKGIEELPAHLHNKTRVMYQSVEKTRGRVTKRKKTFDVCVIGHLRAVKDPFRAALALRQLPPSSRIRLLHIGAALDDEMERTARNEMQVNRRYYWLGEKPRWQARRILASCRAVVLSSLMEGGANVISEAIVAGVPILASRISGTIGLVGENYPGYFPVGDTERLKDLLIKAESEPAFLSELQAWGKRRRHLFAPKFERKTWKNLLNELHCARV